MNIENKIFRILKNTRVLRFFLPLAIVLIAMGILIIVTGPKDYLETKGTVTRYERDTTSEELSYNIYFDYVVDGKTYNGNFNFNELSYNAGDEIIVYYDATNPNNISSSLTDYTFAFIVIGVGAVLAIYSVYSVIKAMNKDKELDNQIKNSTSSVTGQVTQNNYGTEAINKNDTTEYYFRFDGQTFKPGYLIEDSNRQILYEGKNLKNSMIGNRIFQFTNHKNMKTSEHQVGHTMTSTYNNEVFSTTSYFDFDGKNIWDYLHERGIRIQTNLRSKFPKIIYDVTLNGEPYALIETSSMHVHEDDEAAHKIKIPLGSRYYRFWTKETNLGLLFLVMFALSETEQTIAE